MEADDEHVCGALFVPMQPSRLPWLRRRRRLLLPLLAPAHAAANRKECRLIIDTNHSRFKGHVLHVTGPSVRNGQATGHAVELTDNIFVKDTPVVPETAVEHLPMLSDKKYGTQPVEDVTGADDKKNIT